VWLFGGPFGAATPPFRILCAGLPIVFVIWIVHAIAISVDRERLLLRTGLVGLAVNVGLNLYVIPRYGGSGAAFATVVGEAVSLVVLLAGLRTVLMSAGAARRAASTPASASSRTTR
jgi:O-antigen/teichoic acid export membrane protein